MSYVVCRNVVITNFTDIWITASWEMRRWGMRDDGWRKLVKHCALCIDATMLRLAATLFSLCFYKQTTRLQTVRPRTTTKEDAGSCNSINLYLKNQMKMFFKYAEDIFEEGTSDKQPSWHVWPPGHTVLSCWLLICSFKHCKSKTLYRTSDNIITSCTSVRRTKQFKDTWCLDGWCL